MLTSHTNTYVHAACVRVCECVSAGIPLFDLQNGVESSQQKLLTTQPSFHTQKKEKMAENGNFRMYKRVV